MKKKTLVSFLVITIITTLCVFGLSYAESNQDKLNSINQEREDLSSDLESLAGSIEQQQSEIDEIQESIDAKQAEIDETMADIEKTKKDIEDRKEGLNTRLRTMYKNGSVGYLDIILGSGSLSELISNVEMVKKIYKNDQDTLVTLKKQHDELEKREKELKEQQAELDEQRASAESKQNSLESDKAVLQDRLDELDAEAERLSSTISGSQDSNKVYSGETFVWPTTSYNITSWFGPRDDVGSVGGSSNHGAIDIGVASGSPVYAAASGKVIISQWYYGYGYAVVIDHGSGLSTLYGHNSSLKVSAGQTVSKGQVIAASGNTGISTGPHLHFEVRIWGTRVDPMNYFS